MKRACISILALTLLVGSAGIRVHAADDVVLYASDFTTAHGNWALGSNSTAANGQLFASTDQGWSSVDSPLASPADYLEATFNANAATPYHVWLRLRAGNDSKFNDSVWVQFSDAVDAGGAAVFGIGTTSGLLVNLQSCNGCALSGWGWIDGAYWLARASTVSFTATGTHTVRIQTREDGVSIDQVVISAATYLTNAPGPVINDATIVAKGASTSQGSSPFSGAPAALPGQLNAETFDNGGEGVAYHDSTPGNAGGQARNTDVDIESSSEGGFDIGWTAPGEWVNYTVSVPTAGQYVAQLRVASPGGGALHLGFNQASDVWSAVTIPNTGSWQSWTTVPVPVTLGAGVQQVTVFFDTGGLNLRYVNVVAAGSVPSGPGVPTSLNLANGAAGVTLTPNLSWQSAGATSYELRLGTTNPPATYVSNLTTFWYSPRPLFAGTTYFWQVVATNAGGSTTGPIWSFTTAGGSLSAPPPPPPPPGGSGTQLSVLTWNIQVNQFTEAHARLAVDDALAASPQPQVITFQEAWSDFFPAYLDELQKRTGQAWNGVYQQECPPGAWNGSSCTQSWDQIVAVFSTFPIVSSDAIFLPAADCYTSARPGLRAALNVNGTTLQVFTTHLQTGGCNNDAQSRYYSMGLLKAWAANYSTPQLVSGDFNADPDQIYTAQGMAGAFINPIATLGLPKPLTALVGPPTMQLDYWFYDASGAAQPISEDVPGNTGTVSDHLPVRATFKLR